VNTLKPVIGGAVALVLLIIVLFWTGVISTGGREADKARSAKTPAVERGQPKDWDAPARNAKRKRPARPQAAAPAYLQAHLGKQGVTRNIEDAADPELLLAYGLMSSVRGFAAAPKDNSWDEARLVDAKGAVVHRWKVHPFVAEGRSVAAVRVLPNGNLLVVQPGLGLAVLAWDSSVVWKAEGDYRPDAAVDASGRVYALLAERRELDERGGITDQTLVVFSADGKEEQRLAVADAFAAEAEWQQRVHKLRGAPKPGKKNKKKRKKPRKKYPQVFDVATVEVVSAPDPGGRWKAGDALLAMRHGYVAIVSLEAKKSVWAWGMDGKLRDTRGATMAGGQIVVLENPEHQPARTELWGIDPAAGEVRWKYEPTPEDALLARSRGLVQAIGEDRLLIVQSDAGRFLEVDREGRVVWEYFAGEEFRKQLVPVRGERVLGPSLSAVREKLKPVAAPGEPPPD